MTILDRDTLIDRPEIVTREDDDDEQDKGDEDNQDDEPDTIGDGGGPEVHGLEFEESDLDVVAAANTCAVLTTGQEEGEVYNRVFKNAAIQLKDLKVRNRDIDMISYFGLNNAIATVGLSEELRDTTMQQVMENDIEPEPEETDDTPEQTDDSDENADDEDEQSDIDQVEDEIDEMQEEDTEEDG